MAPKLKLHLEEGWHRQAWKDEAAPGERPSEMCMDCRLKAGERRPRHGFIGADAIWHVYPDAPPSISTVEQSAGLCRDNSPRPDPLARGMTSRGVAPRGWWRVPLSIGDGRFVGWTLFPEVPHDGLALAPSDFDIPGDRI
jgi:predicted cupin superfamily sugar epimerase